MLSYFFIPATKLKKIDAIKALNVNEIIIDFEDAVIESDRINYVEKIVEVNNFTNYWYRVPCRKSFNDVIELDLLLKIVKLGVNKIMIPKLKSKDDFVIVFNALKSYKNISFIILIEHPRLLLEFLEILQNSAFQRSIVGIGFGSHDMMNFMSSEHGEEQLSYPRNKVLYLAKAFDKLAIDIATMNISNKINFEKEISFGLEYGFDAKFLIHPIQVEWLEKFDDIKNKQMKWALKIMDALPYKFKGKSIKPFILEGQVVETPHVIKAQSILKKYKNEK